MSIEEFIQLFTIADTVKAVIEYNLGGGRVFTETTEVSALHNMENATEALWVEYKNHMQTRFTRTSFQAVTIDNNTLRILSVYGKKINFTFHKKAQLYIDEYNTNTVLQDVKNV